MDCSICQSSNPTGPCPIIGVVPQKLELFPLLLIDMPDTAKCYRVTEDIYRSGQPSREGFKNWVKMGIKSVMSLREYHSDEARTSGMSLKLYRVPMSAGSLTAPQLMHALYVMRKAPKPMLIHCWHGSDRTGALLAAYRIVVQGCCPRAAEEELRRPEYGFHEFWYSNIPKLFHQTDWAEMRRLWATWG